MRRLRGIGFSLAIVALTVGIIAGVVTAVQHIPRPAKKIEWVRREDSIIVQMKTIDYPGGEVQQRLAWPEFTLYGDGTLIAKEMTGNNTWVLRKATLSTQEVRDLLELFRQTGFFDFRYFEPPGDSVSTVPPATTYFYAAVKNTQNIAGSEFGAALQLGDQPAHYRKLQEIKARLDTITNEALAGSATTAYAPEAIILTVERSPEISDGAPPAWPFAEIDLAGIAPESGFGERRIEADQAQAVLNSATPINGSIFTQGTQRFSVFYRPVLPYEENFPEFETPING
jgi:hypothetical protein